MSRHRMQYKFNNYRKKLTRNFYTQKTVYVASEQSSRPCATSVYVVVGKSDQVLNCWLLNIGILILKIAKEMRIEC
jgi:hypothetical protein